ncbi:hypothetical protein ETI06_04065 [Macrococcoides goetzii]|nr:DUF6612 family protein [Macrococcus goetzii]TDM39685.1 hypothetical protein ETI10_09580 [Macrococcus goetzii]TDM49650.1 hypothetical protein ETI06_04065 [Macrococcus goetzii]
MNSKHLLSALLSTTLIFTACGNDSADKTEDKANTEATKSNTDNQTTEEAKTTESKETTSETADTTKENKDAVDLIEKAKDAGKDIKSYHSSLSAAMESDGTKNNAMIDVASDANNIIKVENTNDNQKSLMYLFDDKVIVNQDGKQFIDVTKIMGKEVKKQIEQVEYKSFVNSLDIYKNAQYKETKNGYSLTMTYKNIEDYKKVAKDIGADDLVKSIENQLKDIKGSETIYFDKNHLVKSSKRDIEMTIKDKVIKNITDISYDNFNKIENINIPAEVKNAKTYEQYQKEMQDKMNSSSTETSTEAK